jgi:hypothetical protein
MPKFLLRFLPLFIAVSAFAQAKVAEPPVEKADMFTVVLFLVLFFGGCAGYVVYLVWTHRKEPKAPVAVENPLN